LTLGFFWQPGSITVTDAVVLFMYLSQIKYLLLVPLLLVQKNRVRLPSLFRQFRHVTAVLELLRVIYGLLRVITMPLR